MSAAARLDVPKEAAVEAPNEAAVAADAAQARRYASAKAQLTRLEPSPEELLSLLRQLPPKPIGPCEEGQQAHSTAKIVLLCASGKGGVGKSTVSVNLSFMLMHLGFDVGLLDLDIYGPSLPELVPLPPDCVRQNQAGRIVPLNYGGVDVMSWGYIQPGEAAKIRAPIATRITTQLLTQVEWGDLDILVIDSPPGTGDVLLTLAQTLTVDGALLVTTANKISLADVVKGLQLFKQVEIPPLAIAVNMAHYHCSSCGAEQRLFADGALEPLLDELQRQPDGTMMSLPPGGIIEMPLDPVLSMAPGVPRMPHLNAYPFVRVPTYKDRPAWDAFLHLAHTALVSVLGATNRDEPHEASGRPGARAGTTLRLRPGGTLEVRLRGGELHPVECCELRATCRCAHCVDEMTGQVKVDRESLRRDTSLRATEVKAVGNYAVGVKFTDGHSSLVAIRAIEEMCGRLRPAARQSGIAQAF